MTYHLDNLSIDYLKSLKEKDLIKLSKEISDFLISSTSKTGGHIGANLGTIELTIALHYVFNSPKDALIFDTGHIGYTHKLITGRKSKFKTLNSYKGLSRFISRDESIHDFVEASHAGTSISLALGRALSLKNQNLNDWSVAVIGDGSLAEGLALEAFNHAAVEDDIKLMILINDNGYSISPGFGGIHNNLQQISMKNNNQNFLSSLGFQIYGPINGHSISEIIENIQKAKESKKVPIIHLKTIKGNGLKLADSHKYRMHFSFPFDIEDNHTKNNSTKTEPPISYQDIASEAIFDAMIKNKNIQVITPSTLYATSLEKVFENFPNRCFDPGMEEQHAMTMTVGMALSGTLPVIFYQSTFLQRAFDQLFHDVCFSNQNILILAVRSGFAGYDNPTHHGIYDISYTKCLPNLSIYYPSNISELYQMVSKKLECPSGPTLILMPYGPVENNLKLDKEIDFDMEDCDIVSDKYKDGVIFTVGNKLEDCKKVISLLAEKSLDYGIVNIRKLKPLPIKSIKKIIENTDNIVTIEESILEGGFGSSMSSIIHKLKFRKNLLQIGLPCKFIEAGSNQELSKEYELDPNSICEKIIKNLNRNA